MTTNQLNLSTEEQHQFDGIAERILLGHLGFMTADGYPRVAPVNFVINDRSVLFHGSYKGEKAESFRKGGSMTFCFYEPLALIPSHWRSDKYGCPASQLYRSVLIKGTGRMIEDPADKARALQMLMEKHQPEGGFEKFDHRNDLYTKAIDEVAIFLIDPIKITIKIKTGQNYNTRVRTDLAKKLVKRGHPGDLESARAMLAHNSEGGN